MLGALVVTQELALGLHACPPGQVMHAPPFQLPGIIVSVSVSCTVLPLARAVHPSVTSQVLPAAMPVVVMVLELEVPAVAVKLH